MFFFVFLLWQACIGDIVRHIWISDILKHTSKSNQDYNALEQALSSVREVMTHINEDKRKTEGQLVMFDIFNDIDNCPVSSLFYTYASHIQVNYINIERT